MALIKCSECGGEVSDRAPLCPHCGNPIKKRKKIGVFHRSILLMVWGAILSLAFILIASVLFPKSQISENLSSAIENSVSYLQEEIPFLKQFLESGTIQSSTINTAPTTIQQQTPLAVQINTDGTKTYPFEQINLWGYTFYTSKIDGSGSVDVGSQNKQTIAKLFLTIGFPRSLANNLAIISTDPTLMKSGDKFQIPWARTMQIPLSIQPEGGVYTQVGNGALILLNGGYDLSILPHELGHHIGFHMTDQEWTQYYKLRGIPSNTPRNPSNWNLSPEEDFAEVYKYTYYSNNQAIRTNYGILVPVRGEEDILSPCYFKALQADPQLQDCRAQNISDYFGHLQYMRQATEETQQFVRDVVARLNNR